MRLFARPHQIPGRLAAGAVIVNSGLTKARADEATATELHTFAKGTYPFLADMDPVRFTRLLAKTEIALGTALLLPIVPSLLAGTALAGFAGGLLGLYLRTPGMREEYSLRPTQQGTALVKDVWLLGIALGLIVEELRARRH
jgi:hypothetical protein